MPPIKSQGDFIAWDVLPFAEKTRRVSMVPLKPRIELGPWGHVADESPLGGLGMGLMAAMGGGPLLELLGMGLGVGGGGGHGHGPGAPGAEF